MKNSFYQHLVDIPLITIKDINGVQYFALDLQPYQESVLKFKFQVPNACKAYICKNLSPPISNGQREYFYGTLCLWVADFWEKRTKIDIPENVKRKDLGEKLLKAILLEETKKENLSLPMPDFKGTFEVETDSNEFKGFSMSKNNTNAKFQKAIDIWCIYFAEFGEDMPLPQTNKKHEK